MRDSQLSTHRQLQIEFLYQNLDPKHIEFSLQYLFQDNPFVYLSVTMRHKYKEWGIEKTEKEIQTSLGQISSGSTTLVIAHRLSTVIDADEILVLSNGEIKERGQHSSLLNLDGLYADLWRRQQDGKSKQNVSSE